LEILSAFGHFWVQICPQNIVKHVHVYWHVYMKEAKKKRK